MTILPTLPRTALIAAAQARPEELSALLLIVGAAGLCALAGIILLRALFSVRGTTLFAPLVWAAISFATLLAVCALLLRPEMSASRLEKWWLIAATSTFCPLVALLGAKRPQDKAWQMIVLSFWGIIALPAIQSLVTHPGEAMELHLLWQVFFVVLILMGALNYISSPFGLAGLVVAVGQAILFWRWLPLVGTYDFWWPSLGVFVLCGAVFLAGLVSAARRRLLVNLDAVRGWYRVWLDFRDSYGLLWSRRVMQRVEEQIDGPIEWIDWYSFSTPTESELAEPEGEPGSEKAAREKPWNVAEPALRSLLRRFVSNEWIDQRIRGEV